LGAKGKKKQNSELKGRPQDGVDREAARGKKGHESLPRNPPTRTEKES